MEEPCLVGEASTDPDTGDEPLEDIEPPTTLSRAASIILPPASNIRRDEGDVDEALVKKGDHPAYDDVQLLNAMTGRVPTSFKLHIIRDAWDAVIRYDLDKTRHEAEQLKALATKAPVGTRGWRLLRDEADRLGQHNALTEMWLTSRTHAPGPAIKNKERRGPSTQ